MKRGGKRRETFKAEDDNCRLAGEKEEREGGGVVLSGMLPKAKGDACDRGFAIEKKKRKRRRG